MPNVALPNKPSSAAGAAASRPFHTQASANEAADRPTRLITDFVGDMPFCLVITALCAGTQRNSSSSECVIGIHLMTRQERCRQLCIHIVVKSLRFLSILIAYDIIS